MPTSHKRRLGAATVDLVLCAVRGGRLQVLVVQSAGGTPLLPYTWCTEGKALDHTARDLAREISGHAVAWSAFGAGTTSKRHPTGAAISLPFVGVVAPSVEAPGGAAWHPIDALPALAPRQKSMAETALEVLRLHMDVAPVAFRLLPSLFTLTDLQQVYELLVGRRLHKASFRRALQAAYLVEPTDEWRSEGRGRPAQLFRYAPRRRRGSHRSVRFDLLSG